MPMIFCWFWSLGSCDQCPIDAICSAPRDRTCTWWHPCYDSWTGDRWEVLFWHHLSVAFCSLRLLQWLLLSLLFDFVAVVAAVVVKSTWDNDDRCNCDAPDKRWHDTDHRWMGGSPWRYSGVCCNVHPSRKTLSWCLLLFCFCFLCFSFWSSSRFLPTVFFWIFRLCEVTLERRTAAKLFLLQNEKIVLFTWDDDSVPQTWPRQQHASKQIVGMIHPLSVALDRESGQRPITTNKTPLQLIGVIIIVITVGHSMLLLLRPYDSTR